MVYDNMLQLLITLATKNIQVISSLSIDLQHPVNVSDGFRSLKELIFQLVIS